MGERLVVTIGNSNKDLCKIHYHWSAFTMNALYETRNILEHIYDDPYENEEELILSLIHFCETHGGGILEGKNSHEWEYIQSIYPQEAFNVCSWYEYFEDFHKEKEYWGDKRKELRLEDIPNIGIDLGLFDIGDIDGLIKSIQNANGYVVRNGNEIYELKV